MRHTHFLGIGGIGMSALAHILLDQGASVSGSDRATSPIIEKLKAKGAQLTTDVKGTIVYSSAIPQDHPELIAAKLQHLPIVHRSNLLAELLKDKHSLLVAGSHGKTSVAGLLIWTLSSIDPSYAFGGLMNDLNGHAGTSDYMVAEADESDGSFLKYTPFGAIITNVDDDHLDYWKSKTNLQVGFKTFIEKVQSEQFLFWCADDPYLASLNLPGTGYTATYNDTGTFNCAFKGKTYSDIELPLYGKHHQLNAAAVFGMALQVGISEEVIRHAFQTFPGIKRRGENKGSAKGVTVFDDYAHHPTEIAVTLQGFRSKHRDKRIVAVFQPHRYTRTRDCREAFADCFKDADVLIVTDIYGCGEDLIEGITSKSVFKDAHYVKFDELTDYLHDFVKKEDILITLGAGHITQIGPQLLKRMQ